MKRFYLLPIVCCALSISLSAQENNGTATTSGADDNRILSADSLITTDARLDSLYQTLPEVMITGERPIVKAAQGKLVYDLPRLIRNLPVDNAYDAVKELPGVIEMNGGLQLAGQLGHHGGLAWIARPQPDGEGVVDEFRVIAHVGDGGGHIRIVLGEYADQYMAFGRLINVDSILFGAR